MEITKAKQQFHNRKVSETMKKRRAEAGTNWNKQIK